MFDRNEHNRKEDGEFLDTPITTLDAHKWEKQYFMDQYAHCWFSVIRLHGATGGWCTCRKKSCGSVGKHPDVGGSWKAYTTKRANSKTRYEWFVKDPYSNIAIVYGAISGIIVVDADGAKGVAELRRRGLPKTPTARTGSGGLHAYFEHPGHPVGNQKLRGVGDLKADGGYVVAPPSRHVSGGRYEWLLGLAPWEVEFTEAPAWLLDELNKPNVKPSDSRIAKPDPGMPRVAPDLSRLSKKFRDLIRRGNRGEYDSRSEADMAVCIALLRAGYGVGEIWTVMTDPAHGISEKFFAKGNQGERYLELTISKAREFYTSYKSRSFGTKMTYARREGNVNIDR